MRGVEVVEVRVKGGFLEVSEINFSFGRIGAQAPRRLAVGRGGSSLRHGENRSPAKFFLILRFLVYVSANGGILGSTQNDLTPQRAPLEGGIQRQSQERAQT